MEFGFKLKMLWPDKVLEYSGHSIGWVCIL